MQIGFAGIWRRKETLDSEGCGLGEGSGLTYLPGIPPRQQPGTEEKGWLGALYLGQRRLRHMRKREGGTGG